MSSALEGQFSRMSLSSTHNQVSGGAEVRAPSLPPQGTVLTVRHMTPEEYAALQVKVSAYVEATRKVEEAEREIAEARAAQERARAKIEAGRVREEAGRAREEAGRVREEAGSAREEAGRVREEAGRAKAEQAKANMVKNEANIVKNLEGIAGFLQKMKDEPKYKPIVANIESLRLRILYSKDHLPQPVEQLQMIKNYELEFRRMLQSLGNA